MRWTPSMRLTCSPGLLALARCGCTDLGVCVLTGSVMPRVRTQVRTTTAEPHAG